MLAPLMFVWPVSIALTYFFANSVASYPYDQALQDHVVALGRLVDFSRQRPSVQLPLAAKILLRSDEVDNVYYRVGIAGKEVIGGDRDLPNLAAFPPYTLPNVIYFRDAEYKGQEIRVAYQLLDNDHLDKSEWVVIEVAETLEKRAQLASKIIASVIVPQFLIIPLAVLLVWFGLTKGLRPLTRLRQAMEFRPSDDLSPISTQRVPDELSPLVETFNNMLLRMQRNLDVQHRFIADAAHQMRTPLAGLKTQAQLALRETNPAQQRASLEKIATSVDRATRLVSQLLTLARTEAGSHGPETKVKLDFAVLLREIVEEWVVNALQHDIDLGYESPTHSSGAWITGNAFLLREMSNNLIDNALRYTQPGGRVTVRLLAQGDFVILEVEDDGIGISEEQSELVFERFYRVNDSASEGSGLGLSIVREIAVQHRASASLRPSTKERGTTARVVFPAWTPPSAVEPSPLPPLIQTGF